LSCGKLVICLVKSPADVFCVGIIILALCFYLIIETCREKFYLL
jgi:hypothetical protein